MWLPYCLVRQTPPSSASDPRAAADPRHELGLAGEAAAIAWLEARGWTVEAHRWRFGRHDIDLVIRQGSQVAFVEVKTRTSGGLGVPQEAVGWRKRRILDVGASWWRERFGRPDDHFRFDVMAVVAGPDGSFRFEHLEGAWRLGE